MGVWCIRVAPQQPSRHHRDNRHTVLQPVRVPCRGGARDERKVLKQSSWYSSLVLSGELRRLVAFPCLSLECWHQSYLQTRQTQAWAQGAEGGTPRAVSTRSCFNQ